MDETSCVTCYRRQFYRDMCGLLKCLTEAQFNSKYDKFKIKWATEKLILNNVATRWAGNCKWHGMWPHFSRLYEHEFVNTTNLVKRLWHFIKYTLLDKKVNRRLDQLIWALIGMYSKVCIHLQFLYMNNIIIHFILIIYLNYFINKIMIDLK